MPLQISFTIKTFENSFMSFYFFLPLNSNSMLQSPSEKSIEEPPLQRPECKYVSDQARFHIQERSYTQQYAGLYFSRLCMLRPVILNRAKKLWENCKTPGMEKKKKKRK